MSRRTWWVRAKDPAKPVPLENVSRHVLNFEATNARLAERGLSPEQAKAGDLVMLTMIYGEPVEVPYSTYYRRLLAAGDIEEVKAPGGDA